MRRKRWVPLSAWELHLIDRCVRGMEAGRYQSVADAARAFLRAAERMRVRHGVPASVPRRDYLSVHRRIRDKLGAKRFGALHSFWRPEELKVLDRYVAALLTRRYATVREAARACFDEFERLRHSGKRRVWAATPRNLRAIQARLCARSQAAGREPHTLKWTPQEWRVIERHARALASGRYPDTQAAAADCHRELARWLRALPRGRPRPPARPLRMVYQRVSIRAHQFGWSHTATLWLPEERLIVERYVRGLSDGSLPWVTRAARDCCRELRCLRDRLRAEAPQEARRMVRRTFKTVSTYLSRWSLKRGRPDHRFWTARNLRIAAAHALALVEGRSPSALAAARECYREIARQYRHTRRRRTKSGRATDTPTFPAIYDMLLQQAHKLQRPWPVSRWTASEYAVSRRWARWYGRRRRLRRNGTLKTSVAGMREELEELGSRRTRSACRIQLLKSWHQMCGMA